MPKRGKNRIVKTIDFSIMLVIFIVLVTMFFRRGETISDLQCSDCNSTIQCRDMCFGTCLKKGYDSITAGGYANQSNEVLCDCRCDHFLHSLISRKKCEKPLIQFGNSCCSDLDNSTVCDKYEVIDLSRMELEGALKRLRCPEACDDGNICTKDECSAETAFECRHIETTPCCGNNICEETENCLSCFRDCGSCMTVDGIKNFINENFEEQEWKKIDDNTDKDLVYHSYKNNEIIVVEILNEKKFLKTYNQFLNFNFMVPETNETSSRIWKLNILEEKQHNLIFGKVKDYVGYYKKDEKDILFHHFNIHCAPDTYIRIQPGWSYNNYVTLDSYDDYKNINKFKTDSEEILPKISMLLQLCPLRKKDPDMINLTEKINTALNKDYTYIKKDDDYNDTITNYYPLKNNKIMILKLDEGIKDDLFGFEKNRFNHSLKWINDSISLFEDSITNYYQLSDRLFITYKKYHSHKLNKYVFENEVNKLENHGAVETLHGDVYIYEITYKKLDKNGAFMGYSVENELKSYVEHKISALCKPGIIIELTADDTDATGLNEENIIPNLRNMMEENREKLLVKINKILEVCS